MPLTVIMTNAELLAAPGCSPAERQQFSGSILTVSAQMRGLVESLLELARADSGRTKREFGRTDLSLAVTDALLPFEPVFFEAGLRLSAEIAPDLFVKGDAGALKQVAGILLDNARKYSRPGGETAVTLERCGKSLCRLTVANQGEAISGADLKNIFRRFYRVDKARTMDRSYGLGLPIAQTIAEAHKGCITAESKDGWNRFYLELPTVP